MIVKTDEALHSTSCGCVRDTGARRAGNCEQSVGGELPHGRSSTLQSSRLLVLATYFCLQKQTKKRKCSLKINCFRQVPELCALGGEGG